MPRGVYPRTPEIRASLSAAARARHGEIRPCSVEGCSRDATHRRAGLCGIHYTRVRRHGNTAEPQSRRRYPPTYRGAHRWVELDRGKAASHSCADCGERAGHWSFAHRRVPQSEWLWTDGSDGTRPYTGNVFDYDPRCFRCAHRYDRPY